MQIRSTTYRKALLFGVIGLLPFLAGCPSPRTSNQGGGSVVTAAAKLSSGDVAAMTADEWQIAVDNLPTLAEFTDIDLSEYDIPQLTDEQAQAIVDFIIANNITSLDDILALDINEIEIPEALQSLVDLFV